MELSVDGLLESYATDPAVRQACERAVTLILMDARDKDSQKNVILKRGLNGIDPSAIRGTMELEERRASEFENTFGRKP